MTRPHPAFAGLGDAQQIGNQVVVPAVQIAGTASAKSLAAILGVSVPIVGAALAGVTIALAAWFNRKGPQQKVASTQIVDELEKQLAANRDAYLAGPRTYDRQLVAIENFNRGWEWLHSAEACGSPALGKPGERCLSDRERSGRWPWEVYYLDPIANDPEAHAAAAPPGASGGSIESVLQAAFGGAARPGGTPAWVPIAALALLAAAVWL